MRRNQKTYIQKLAIRFTILCLSKIIYKPVVSKDGIALTF